MADDDAFFDHPSEVDINPIMRDYIGEEASSLIPDPRTRPLGCSVSDEGWCRTHRRWKCQGDPQPASPSPQEKFFYQAPALLARILELARACGYSHQIELELVQLRHQIENLNRRFTQCKK